MTDFVEGFPVLAPGSKNLHTWDLGEAANRKLTHRNGSVGLVLAHNALRFNDLVEPLDQPAERNGGIDDGGYSYRRITGGSGWSKHATGCADDLNWRKHPYGTKATANFTREQIAAIEKTLNLYRDPKTGLHVVEWGGHWPSHPGSSASPDPMHFQISSQVRMEHVERVARKLMDHGRGKRLLALNPGQAAVILS